jgi:hypothetical protein
MWDISLVEFYQYFLNGYGMLLIVENIVNNVFEFMYKGKCYENILIKGNYK